MVYRNRRRHSAVVAVQFIYMMELKSNKEVVVVVLVAVGALKENGYRKWRQFTMEVVQ